MINSMSSELNLTPVAKSVDVILVPQGAELRAVCRGLKPNLSRLPKVMAIPMGCQSLSTYLQKWKQSREFLNKPPRSVLLMGLCGGLSSHYKVGEIVIYSECGYLQCPSLLQDNVIDTTDKLLGKECDRHLVRLLQDQLKERATVVKGLTSDRLIGMALRKRELYQQYQRDVVDMEGFTALDILTEAGVQVAMIRVISDEGEQDLPNITSAISSDGSLKPLPLAISMIQKPIAAIRLIQGSLKGLRVLQQLTCQLFCTNSK